VAECVGVNVGPVERNRVTVGIDLIAVQCLQATCPLADRSTKAVAAQMSLRDRRPWKEVLLRRCRDRPADVSPFVDRVCRGLQYRKSATVAPRLMVVVDQNWPRGIPGYAIGSQAGDFQGAAPSVAQDYVRGKKHLVGLLGGEDPMSESNAQRIGLGGGGGSNLGRP
jgi:hypothetical protein